MKIESFTFDGRIIIEFDQEMFIPESLKQYKLTTKTIEPDYKRRILANFTEEAFVFL